MLAWNAGKSPRKKRECRDWGALSGLAQRGLTASLVLITPLNSHLTDFLRVYPLMQKALNAMANPLMTTKYIQAIAGRPQRNKPRRITIVHRTLVMPSI